MKSIISVACLLLVACALAEARPKRSVFVAAAPAVAVASVPVVQSQVVHHNPTTVVKTEQVRSGDHASYTYSSEVKTQPIVHQTHAVAAVAQPVVASAAYVAPAHHYAAAVVPHAYTYTYPASSYYATHYYSPYNYVIGK